MTTRWALAGFLLGGAMVFLMSCSAGVPVTSADPTTSLVTAETVKAEATTTEIVTTIPSVEEPPPETLGATGSDTEWDRQAEDVYLMEHLVEILSMGMDIGQGGEEITDAIIDANGSSENPAGEVCGSLLVEHRANYGAGGSVADAEDLASAWPGEGGDIWLALSNSYTEMLEACARGDREEAVAASVETADASDRFGEWVDDLRSDFEEHMAALDS